MSEMSSKNASENLWRHGPFVRYWFAAVFANFGYHMISIALAWQVYGISHRALDLGLIGLMQFIPSLLLALPAGHVADQYERRKISLWGYVAIALCALSLGVLTILGSLSLLGIYALILIMGVAKAFEFPASKSMLPSLVPPSMLPKAIALNASAGQAARIAGPALGGFLYMFGPSVVYLFSAFLCLAAVLLLGLLRSTYRPTPREPMTLSSLFAGASFIRSNPDILGVISLDLFAVLLGGATALLPIYAKDILHTGPWGLGLLRAAPAVGALMMSLVLVRFPLRRRVGLVMFASVAGFGLVTLIFAFSHWMGLSLGALLLLGAFDMVSVVIRGSLVQLESPDEMLGRVNGINAIFINTSNQLGEFESGILAAWVGALSSTVIGGIGTLAVVALWMYLFPGLRRRQTLETRARSL